MSALFSKARLIGLALAALVAALDQWSKWYVTRGLLIDNIGDNMPLLPFFDLTFTRNYGISLGMFEATSMEMRWILVLLTAGIALAVLVWMMRERVLADIIGLALILGGALGNIYDRVRYGYVIDFADLHFEAFESTIRPFLIFNVADAAITIGVIVILARALFFGEKDEGNGSETSGETNAALEN
ncbi:MAG: signal peptidase II [Pseudomonadota bacterium]